MTPFAHIAMVGWVPLVLLMFAWMSPRRAILVAYIGGFLFLPNAGYELSGLPDFNKPFASGLAALLGVLFFHLRGLLSFNPRWFDLPMLVFCASPVATSILNGLGIYDGVSELVTRIIEWGLPYFLGRMYFSDRRGMYELALAIFIGGLVYVPLCLWEIRMSPNLHYQIYGFRTRSFSLGMRYGGFRPSVFLWSFIPVATWLAMATVSGFWLWWTGRTKQLLGVPIVIPLAALATTMLLTRTLSAVVLMLVGIGILLTHRRIRKPTILALLVVLVPLVLGARATGAWRGEELVDLARLVNETRADSLLYRFENEDLLANKALQRPFFGWGGYSRSRVFNEYGRDISVTDGFWIIVLGRAGLIGLGSFLAIFMVSLLRFDRRFPGRSWMRPDVAPAAIAATLAAMALVNNVPNSTGNPLVQMALGAVVAFGPVTGPRRRLRRPPPEAGAREGEGPSAARAAGRSDDDGSSLGKRLLGDGRRGRSSGP